MTAKYQDLGMLGEGCEFVQLDMLDMTVADPIELNEFKRGIPDGGFGRGGGLFSSSWRR